MDTQQDNDNFLYLTLTGSDEKTRNDMARLISFMLACNGVGGATIKVSEAGGVTDVPYRPSLDTVDEDIEFIKNYKPGNLTVLLAMGDTISTVVNGVLLAGAENGTEH